ncbi:hypothetical protein EYZ11_006489 [Aspergillus tanneri]|uniref:Uncharacterized protein n=1 Tax=Aspergillus tanneri TaxID=1220188 RepID=A0A4S3JHN5_9EURO|nr:hypothetical protein EYZ11_006489 [Aspergillus tanneri]
MRISQYKSEGEHIGYAG